MPGEVNISLGGKYVTCRGINILGKNESEISVLEGVSWINYPTRRMTRRVEISVISINQSSWKAWLGSAASYCTRIPLALALILWMCFGHFDASFPLFVVRVSIESSFNIQQLS